ncbi:hypothetical protein GCM10017044_10790 [Kordiimonas sediminis]|uniref:Tail tape measure protein n=1 Tax=Kordiimonas sediminis TaxID=1735581 RepID=A0A919AQ99_9PROT|nr:phage tail tape measure protein [Kordiimonas sediminis]GHF18118.1 hypothetical protein GCM10017044_10790 [Kordiimonas sediminis]
MTGTTYDSGYLQTKVSGLAGGGDDRSVMEAGKTVLEASMLLQKTGSYLASGGKTVLTGGGLHTVSASNRTSSTQALPSVRAIEDAFRQAARGIRLDFDDLGGSVQNIFRDVAQNILGSLTSVVNQSVGGGFLGSVFSGLMPVLGFAGGGRVQANKPILVGERGREIVVPSRPATVMNAADSRPGFGPVAPVVHITNHFDLTPSPAIAAMIENAAPAIRDAAVASTINVLRRGG